MSEASGDATDGESALEADNATVGICTGEAEAERGYDRSERGSRFSSRSTARFAGRPS